MTLSSSLLFFFVIIDKLTVDAFQFSNIAAPMYIAKEYLNIKK